MRLLLGTHTFIWWDSAPDRLSKRARGMPQDPGNDVVLSVVSAWEMQIKQQLGKLDLRQPLAAIIEDQRRLNQMHVLPVDLDHVLALDALPAIHKDPFDRLLIAQAQTIEAPLLSKDTAVSQYPVQTLW